MCATCRREADEARAEHDRLMGALERRAEAAGYLVSAEGGNSLFVRVRYDVLAALLDAAGMSQSDADLATARHIADNPNT